jgi:hypothetical protein
MKTDVIGMMDISSIFAVVFCTGRSDPGKTGGGIHGSPSM